jgi:APA family basic amino acid/polyamine antiporter
MQESKLIRGLGLGSSVSVVAGSVIGSGIFLVATDITRQLPSPGWALSVWLVAGLLSLMGGLTFAELGAMFPGAGGQYIYLRKAFGPIFGFLYGWTLALVIQPGSIAAVAIGFAQYASAFLPMGPVGAKFTASVAIALFTLINALGVKRGAGVLNVLTSLKILALVALGAAGVFLPVSAGAGLSATSATPVTASAYGIALIAAFWAYDGWNNLTFVAGEVANPKRNVPLALILGLALVASLYVLVNVGYFQMLSPQRIAESSFPAADAARVMGGEWAVRGILLAVILSTLGCVNGMVLAGARVTYAMAADGALPRALGYVHPRFHVPSAALFTQLGVSLALVWSGSFDQLFTYVVCAAFIFYGLSGAAVIVLRRTMPKAERPYRVPLYPVLPALYVVFTFLFVLNAFREKPAEAMAGLGIVLLGIPAFYVFRK